MLSQAQDIRQAVWTTVGGETDRFRNPCAPSPGYCDWAPFSDWMPECHPIDPAKCQLQDFGPALTPAMRELALKKGQASTDAYLRANPEMRRAWEQWLDLEWLYKFEAPAGLPSLPSPADTWTYLGLAAAGVGAFLLLTGRR